MRETTRRKAQPNWGAVGIVVPVAILCLVAVIVLRHRILVSTPQAPPLPASTVGPPPNLSSIRRNPGHATISLDVVVINGKSTVVAGLKKPRTFAIAPSDTVGIAGWAFDPAAAAPAGGLIVRYGMKSMPATYGLARQDVATAYNLPNVTFVGFNRTVSGRSLNKGTNPLSFAVISHDLKSYYVNPTEVVLDLR